MATGASVADLGRSASPCSSAGGAAKRRLARCGDKAASTTFAKLQSELQGHEDREHEAYIVQSCRAHPELSQLVRAVIKKYMLKKAKEEKEACLRQSVHRLRDVPGYVIRKTLSAMTDVDESFWKNLPGEETMWCFCLALDACEDHNIPSKGMQVDAFIKWSCARYIQQGALLSGVQPALGYVDWEVAVGMYYIVVPSNAGDDTLLVAIGSRKHARQVFDLDSSMVASAKAAAAAARAGHPMDRILDLQEYAVSSAALFALVARWATSLGGSARGRAASLLGSLVQWVLKPGALQWHAVASHGYSWPPAVGATLDVPALITNRRLILHTLQPWLSRGQWQRLQRHA